MEDKNFNKALKLIKKQQEYNSSQNISDYWFNNIVKLSGVLNKKWPNYSTTFSLFIRWHSDIGRKCREEIHNYIREIQEIQKKANQEQRNRSKNTNNIIYNKSQINFNSFTFTFKNKAYNLQDFANKFNNSDIIELYDLRGIDLSGIRIEDCIISNCCFAYANFSNSYIHQTDFNNCIFTNANFDNAKLLAINYDDKTSFGNISIKNTFINVVNLKGFLKPKNLEIVSYCWLIKEFLKALFSKTSNNSINSNKNHTVFWLLDTRNNTEKENIEFISYVDWFQYITTKIYNIREESILNKVRFFLALITTKYYSSCKILVFFSCIINTIYSSIYYFLRTDFKNIKDFGDCIYFSIVTFTTLGFGDITPKEHGAQFFIISEVIVGYTILGVFVFLLSKKISKLF